MIPVVVLAVLFVAFSLAGRLGVPFIWGWWTSLRFALCGMFLLTASAHWGKRRPDLVRMVPPVFPKPALLVTLTGIIEILGALGLLIPYTARLAALGLCVLLFCLFPANVRAAREKLTIAGRPVPSLLPRAAIQVVFVAATLAVVFGAD
ncbi:MAG TPA: DoxX family membrane protein [Bryobacteraceae bacterium]